MKSKRLLNAITAPSRIACLFKKSSGRPLLTLDIQRERVGMAMIWSPLGEDDVEPLPDISFNSRRIPQESLMTIASIIRSHDVCGLIVGWPLQPYSGKMGGPCGRVLFTLESMLEDTRSATPILSAHRPFSFWTPQSIHSVSETEDEWGRCAAYSRPSTKTLHRASVEQYSFQSTAKATDLWNDFWKAHWPDLHKRNEDRKRLVSASCGSNNLVADWRDAPAYHAAEAAM